MITRISKIARLPKEIRDQLNRRLENGQIGRTLLPWLNALPETKTVLAELFAGKAITHQNLSEWRRAGYQDWLQQQQRIDWFDHFCENETELAKHENCGDTFEAMSRIFIVEIGQSIAALRNLKNLRERSDCLQNLVREFSRLQNAFNFSRKVQLDFDKHNGPPAAEPIEDDEENDKTIEEPDNDEHAPLGAPASRRHDAPNSPEPHTEPEATSPSPPQKGGLELLGKQRKESAESGGPPRAERAGASESLGWGEEALRAQGDHQNFAHENESEESTPTCVRHPAGLPEESPACQAIPPYSPTPPPSSPTPVHKHIVHSIPIRGRRFRCIEG